MEEEYYDAEDAQELMEIVDPEYQEFIDKGKTLFTEPSTKFGIKFDMKEGGAMPMKDIFTAALKFSNPIYLRQSSVSLSDFKGKVAWLDDGYTVGCKAVLNLTWVRPGTEGKKFCRDIQGLRDKLRLFLDKYSNIVEVVAYENEPTTDKYWGDDIMLAYIDGLVAFCDVCKEYETKCTDGCTHVNYYTQWLTNARRQSKNVPQVKELILAYSQIKNLDYINLHHRALNDPNEIQTVVNWIKGYTGKPVMCNEFHCEVDEAKLNNGMSSFYLTGAKFFILWNGGERDPWLTDGTNLTKWGETYNNLMSKFGQP